MSAVVTFVPDELNDFAAQANTWAVALREEAFDLEGALARFRAGSGEFVPAVPDHPVTIEGLGDRLAALADSVAALGAAAEQADREGLRLRDVLLTVGGGVRTADKTAGGGEALVHLSRFGTYSVRAGKSRMRLAAFDRRWGTGHMPDIRRVRQSMPDGFTRRRPEVRTRQLEIYRKLKDQRAAARRAYDNALQGLRTRRPVTGLGQRVRHFLHDTPTGRVVTRGGRVLGGAGVALGTYDAVTAFQRGDIERGLVSSISAGGGLVMLLATTPVGIGIGATLVVGVLIYEAYKNREAIGDAISGFAEDAADSARSVIEGAASVLGDLF